MSQNNNKIESRLWSAADELRANSKLKSTEYSVPVLGLIFLRYGDHNSALLKPSWKGKVMASTKSGRPITRAAV